VSDEDGAEEQVQVDSALGGGRTLTETEEDDGSDEPRDSARRSAEQKQLNECSCGAEVLCMQQKTVTVLNDGDERDSSMRKGEPTTDRDLPYCAVLGNMRRS